MAKKCAGKILFYSFIILFTIVWLSPILSIVLTSTKTLREFNENPLFSLPSRINWSNFPEAVESAHLFDYMKNSLIITFIQVPIGIVIQSMAAFALTRLHLKRSTAIFLFFLFGMMIPLQVILIPINLVMNTVGLTNTYQGMIVLYIGTQLSFGIFILRGFFRVIPHELDESARLDGCTNMGLFLRILLPMAKPAVATLVILQFLGSWNEYLLASLFMLKPNMRTIPAGLNMFFGESNTNYPLLSAAVLLSVIPVLIVYIIFQKHFVEGLAGAMKG